jgi:DNA-binding winged helix-turn-helix (wHTH) protein/tetratricopeptide (TPR) repeat protein
MSRPEILRFATFELHPASGELRRGGELLKLAPQPFKVLELLARRSGEVTTRVELRDHVWRGDTFVDFEQGLNFCIRQIREVLGDRADAPRFIETLPRRGYRFLMPVKSARLEPSAMVTRLIVLPFTMLRPDSDAEFLALSLPDALTASLVGLQSLVVRSSNMASRFVGDAADLTYVAREADVDFVVTGTVLRAGGDVRVTTQLTNVSTGALVSSNTAQAPLGDVFRLQDALTQRIITSLALPLTVREQQMLKRDVPANAAAYEYFLRGNQLSYDSRQWSVARELYVRSVEEDPRFAPAWARLGRMHLAIGKYFETSTRESLKHAETAFRRALELNPDLQIAHKLLAQLDADRGRAYDAMTRLLARDPGADPELLAGLVMACRYCGLLDASAAAHERARALEPKIRTSVPHTWFLQGDYARVAELAISGNPYIVSVSMAELGRGAEAIPVLRELEPKVPARIRDFMVATRTLLEGDAKQSIAAIGRVAASDFSDPEGLFLLARTLARLNKREAAIALLERAVNGGFFCLAPLERDPWLDALRKKPAFTRLLRRAGAKHQEALVAFERLGGDNVLSVAPMPG